MSNVRRASRWLTQEFGLALPMSLLLMGSLLAGVFGRVQMYAQDDRRVITRVEPEYPDALKKLYIGGVVRVEIQVSPNGTVKSAKLLGGSPILGQSMIKAVKQWKYAAGAAEQTLTVTYEFDPHR